MEFFIFLCFMSFVSFAVAFLAYGLVIRLMGTTSSAENIFLTSNISFS